VAASDGFVWAFQRSDGARVRIPESHLTIWPDAFRLPPSAKAKTKTPSPGDNTNPKE
jgi:hypothetical protein